MHFRHIPMASPLLYGTIRGASKLKFLPRLFTCCSKFAPGLGIKYCFDTKSPHLQTLLFRAPPSPLRISAFAQSTNNNNGMAYILAFCSNQIAKYGKCLILLTSFSVYYRQRAKRRRKSQKKSTRSVRW